MYRLLLAAGYIAIYEQDALCTIYTNTAKLPPSVVAYLAPLIAPQSDGAYTLASLYLDVDPLASALADAFAAQHPIA